MPKRREAPHGEDVSGSARNQQEALGSTRKQPEVQASAPCAEHPNIASWRKNRRKPARPAPKTQTWRCLIFPGRTDVCCLRSGWYAWGGRTSAISTHHSFSSLARTKP